MRVALACPYAWDAPGGVQVHVRQLAERLRGMGHRTLVLAPAWSLPEEPGFRAVGRPIALRFNGSVAPVAPDPRALGAIRRALDEFGADVVHVHEPFAPSTGMLAALAAHRPVVATFHAYAERSLVLALAAPLLRPVWRRLSVRIAVSEAAASFAGRHFDNGFAVVPNGVDVDRFRNAQPVALPGVRRILFVGRLEPRKGFRFAVRAFAKLAAADPGVALVVAGDGPERRALSELELDARRRVVMLGGVPYADLPRYHAAADAFVAPNTGGESFGIVLAEAMAAGLPVVASDIAGYRDVVRHGREGLLVPPGDPAALAAALGTVLADRLLAERLSRAGRERAERFRWDVVAAQIEAAYHRALRDRGSDARC